MLRSRDTADFIMPFQGLRNIEKNRFGFSDILLRNADLTMAYTSRFIDERDVSSRLSATNIIYY